jgi:hypothetical protein
MYKYTQERVKKVEYVVELVVYVRVFKSISKGWMNFYMCAHIIVKKSQIEDKCDRAVVSFLFLCYIYIIL